MTGVFEELKKSDNKLSLAIIAVFVFFAGVGVGYYDAKYTSDEPKVISDKIKFESTLTPLPTIQPLWVTPKEKQK